MMLTFCLTVLLVCSLGQVLDSSKSHKANANTIHDFGNAKEVSFRIGLGNSIDPDFGAKKIETERIARKNSTMVIGLVAILINFFMKVNGNDFQEGSTRIAYGISFAIRNADKLKHWKTLKQLLGYLEILDQLKSNHTDTDAEIEQI